MRTRPQHLLALKQGPSRPPTIVACATDALMSVHQPRSLTNRGSTLVRTHHFEGLILGIALVLVLVAFGVACGSQDSESDLVATSRLEAVIPPCVPLPDSNVDPCARRDDFPRLTPHIQAAIEIPEIVETLEDGFIRWSERPFWAIHFVVRATAIPGSTRCGPAIPSVDHYSVYSPDLLVIVDNHSFCYVDVAVNEYLIGQGPARLTATLGESPFYNHLTDSECDELCRRRGAEVYLEAGIEGVELILLLGGPRKLGQGAWDVQGSYDVQRKMDGTIVVVRRHKGAILEKSKVENYSTNLSRLERPLNEFRDLMTDAYETFVELTGGLTGTVNDEKGRLPPKLASNAGPAGFNDFLVRTRLFEDTPAPPPTVPGENDPNPAGLTINDIIATRVAGGIRIPGGLEDTPTPVSALGDEPTATSTAPTPESEESDE